MIVSSIKKKWQGKIIDLWKGKQWQKEIWTLCSFFFYLLILPKLGYLVTTFGLMVFMMAIIERWRVQWFVLSAMIIVLASYLLFNILLAVSLPNILRGFFFLKYDFPSFIFNSSQSEFLSFSYHYHYIKPVIGKGTRESELIDMGLGV